ncbi:hypothetical protein OG369_43450 [Streptomyces sp. NBC_01221]|uniref:hypothetical protein n=1 Tax=Streptomyces sp. NBC_01221 TaxID=2903782 RepID=UPI0022551F34|nr:hypothetical protein [Streptomyces sp. NBC_01221]MCX4792635.1 hypothetical protein [Streptomyces sp. NBC_01221]
MFEKRRARRETQIRHRRLMEAALDLVGLTGTAPAAPADLTALVFGRHCMEIGEEEAARYLDAARVQRLPGEEPEPAAVN